MSDAPQDFSREGLVYDWNTVDGGDADPGRTPEFDDETLRDGLQGPSANDPTIDQKIGILHLMEALGIDTADLGLPGAGPHQVRDVTALCEEIAKHDMNITPNCAARTLVQDVEPIAEISQKVGMPIEACTFIGSSPIRQYVEGWTLDKMLKTAEKAVTWAVEHDLPVMFVTEDTTRATPETVEALYKSAIEWGARRLCVCDTVGHATPDGVRNLVSFVRRIADESGEDVKVDWHGHKDRGLDVINTLAAFEAGADRLHGAGIGIGERAGNTPMDQLLVNCKLLGWIDRDLSALDDYAHAVSEAVGMPIPTNYPVVGDDAFETGTGVHAAAVIKALDKGDDWLADRVYSGVPAGDFGLSQKIRIGPMSGRSNVLFWLKQRGIEATDELVDTIFDAAKSSTRLLTEQELEELAGVESRAASA